MTDTKIKSYQSLANKATQNVSVRLNSHDDKTAAYIESLHEEDN